MKKSTILCLIGSFLLMVVVFVAAILIGKYSISLEEFNKALFLNDPAYATQRSIILNLRLPRTIIACLTGIALSISGLLYQEVFQNKLTSPDLLGVSTGASVGAAIAIILNLSSALVSLFAFVVGIITVFITITVSKLIKGNLSLNLILGGIIVGGLMSSILSFVKYLADPATTLSQITYWLLGSFENSKMSYVYVMLPIVIVSLIVVVPIAWRFNVLNLGPERAKARGLNYNVYKYLVICFSTLLTASTVAFCGTISWVGLLIPHLVRLIVGKNTLKSIPFCITLGGTFMIIVDVISRSFSDSEIPLSAITGIIGALFFILLLIIQRRNKHVY